MTPAFLDVTEAEKSFAGTRVLDGVDLQVARGEFVSLLGPSGCGKTTLLRIVAGLLAADHGGVRLDGEDISRKPPHRRDVGVVFQNYALFPHLSVADNVAFGLRARGADKELIAKTVARFLALVDLGHMAERSVRGLSGGQQQRVAVARALAVGPKLLLLDEPFSALDRKLRETMQIELKRILRELEITAVFVTHDQDEALIMSDRIAVMSAGRIDQYATPETIYHKPATAFALDFVGLSTRLDGKVVTEPSRGEVSIETAFGIVNAPGSFLPGTPVIVGVRPERIAIGLDKAGNRANAILRDIVFQGARAQLHFQTSGMGQISGSQRVIVETVEVPAGIAPGKAVDLSWAVADTLVYPAGEASHGSSPGTRP